jgi:dsDNA-specific endonuclease/ATPase MutS2
MDKDSRMLVISGPNAGGKSITLKTVGLLQVMLQSGLLVPVAPGSKMSFFHAVLTDIGDNQSIENQLSTYSYRLKRMKHSSMYPTEDRLCCSTSLEPDRIPIWAEHWPKCFLKSCITEDRSV